MKALVRALGMISIGLALVSTVPADQEVTGAFALPMQVTTSFDSSDCDNSPGPVITLSGEITLGEIKARLIFKNNAKGTHTAVVETQSDVVILPAGETITLPKQPVLGGVGGNPHIFFQFHDGNGTDYSEEIYLGRCVQGLTISRQMLEPVLARLLIGASGCYNNPGPWITMGGDLTLGGLHGRFIFKNNLKGTHTAAVERDVALLAEGTKIVLPKQPSRGGVGGNPWISFQWLGANDQPMSEPILLGRCNKL